MRVAGIILIVLGILAPIAMFIAFALPLFPIVEMLG